MKAPCATCLSRSSLMSDLTDFLFARIAEDEAGAKAATPGPWYWEPPSGKDWTHGEESLRTSGRKMRDAAGRELEWDDSVLMGWGYDASGIDGEQADRDHIARHNPARVLADCEAKRQLVTFATELISKGVDSEPWAGEEMLARLSLAYADHPDYREEWRP